MTAVVVQAHPFDESYSAGLAEVATQALRSAGVDPLIVRLGQGGVLDGPMVEQARHLVFVYPTWWGTVPAMLFGPLTELLAPWVDGDAPGSTSPLRGVQRLTVITTYGGSRTINLLQGEAGRHFWKRTVVGLCAPGAEHDVLAFYDVVHANEDQLARFADRVRRALSASA